MTTAEAVHAQGLGAAAQHGGVERVVVEVDEEEVALLEVEGVGLLGQPAEVGGQQRGDPALDYVALLAELQRLLQLHRHAPRQRCEV